MPAPLSSDLRTRFITAYNAGEGTIVELSRRFNIGVATGGRWVARWKAAGNTEPRQPGGGNEPVLTPSDRETIRALVRNHPAATINELVELFVAGGGRRVSRTTMSRAVLKLGFTRKKTRRGSKRSPPRK